jgi:2,3-bisphosphoglycerate-dependent phosphoglycerate mutase
MTTVVYETHSITEDNLRGVATGWLPGDLAPEGVANAEALGARRRDDGLDAVLVSDLHRAARTAAVAFAGTAIPVLHDWHLRECDYGVLNGHPRDEVRAAVAHPDDRHPGGESWAEAIARVGVALDDIPRRWPGGRVLVIGHMATYWALEHRVHGAPLTGPLDGPFTWQEGWEYDLRG